MIFPNLSDFQWYLSRHKSEIKKCSINVWEDDRERDSTMGALLVSQQTQFQNGENVNIKPIEDRQRNCILFKTKFWG